MTKNPEYYRWPSYILIFLAVFQITMVYDTVSNRQQHEKIETAVKDSNISRINGGIISKLRSENNKISAGDFENGKTEDEHLENVEFESDDDVNYDSAGPKTTLKGIELRKVFWLNERQFDMRKTDYYSGSWLIPIERLEPVLAVDIKTLEDGTFNVFNVNSKHARMSVDWLDFSVEHMSRWVRQYDMFNERHNDVAFNKITGNLMKYIQKTPGKTKALLAAHEQKAPLLHPTIAIISVGTEFIYDSVVSKDRSKKFTVAMLGAVVASLMRAGFGRIVFVVVNEDDNVAVKKTLDLLAQTYTGKGDWVIDTQLASVLVDEELYKTDYVDIHKPRAAIYGLQQALRGNFNSTYTSQWLGSQPRYWKYVYFSENDLLLQTRPASLPAFHTALEHGRSLFPHRLELIPHELDMTTENGVVYDGTKDFLPATGDFINILDLDGDEDMCCDGGNDRPSWDMKDDPGGTECYSWWWSCGYTREWQDRDISDKIKHRRILKYTPFIRLKEGTNIISISGTEHERKCHPRKRKNPNDVCEQPSKSGRSFATSEERVEQ